MLKTGSKNGSTIPLILLALHHLNKINNQKNKKT